MKTKIYHLTAAIMLLGANFTYAETGKQLNKSNAKQHKQVVYQSDTANQTGSEKLRPEQALNTLNRAMGVVPGGSFLQDVRVYDISNHMRMAVGYVSGTVATEIGLEGFKVGDRVTWEPQMADKQSAESNKNARHFTGTVDLLDSDKCYIKVDHSKMVAVKLYEDITLLNP